MKTKKQGKKVARICAKYAKVETAISHCNKDSEMIEAVKKHYVRKKEHWYDYTVKSWIDNRLTDKLEDIACTLPDENYSMGSIVRVWCTKLVGVDDRRQRYANSCTWRPTYGMIGVRITPDELRHIECIGGLVTYIYPNQHARVKKCWWYAGRGQKQYFEMIKVEGYVFAGYHATDKAKALAGGLKNIELQKEAKKRAE